MTSPLPARSLNDLDPADQKRLEDALGRLREAVKAYEPFDGGTPVHDEAAMWRAQEDVEAAERELWRLREELLGWSRPAWAPPATFVADWFSEEDRVYDDIPIPPEG